jgi:hypothetical protein
MAITSQPQRAGFPLSLQLPDDCLPRPSWVKISQVRTIPTERIGRRIGEVAVAELNQIIEGLTELMSWNVINTCPGKIEDRAESPIAGENRKSEECIASLIASAFDESGTHIQETEKRLTVRFDSIDSELDMSAELIQTALHAMARLTKVGPPS